MIPSMAHRTDRLLVRIDPRVRLVTAFVASVVLALAHGAYTIGIGVLAALGLCVWAQLSFAALRPRLVAVNGFMLMLVLVLPWSVPGEPIGAIGAWTYTREGLEGALWVALKGNAILLLLTALVSTMDTATLGHALEHLRLPRKLVHLFLFTVRYMEVVHGEAQRLMRAARARSFVAGPNKRTYHAMASLVGTLFLRSLDRSDRILAAMKARGYQGRFYLLNHFHFTRRDAAFAACSLAAVLALAWLEWGGGT